MIDIRTIFKTTERFVIRNSPAIMTGIGVAGVIATAVLTGRAAYSAAIKIKLESVRVLPREEAIKLVWKEFIPPAIVATVSICAIICANRVESRRAAAVAAAFKISQRFATEYQERAAEALGKKGDEDIRADIAKNRLENLPNIETIIIDGTNVLVYDERSDRAFESSMEKIRSAVNQINYEVNQNFYATLTDFYNLLGLKSTQESDQVGWSSDRLMEVWFSSTLMNDKPALMINYNVIPAKQFDRASH